MTQIATINDKRIHESSGLARSVFDPTSGWTVIDDVKKGKPVLFRVGFHDGAVRCAVTLSMHPLDSEAVAVDPVSRLVHVGDLGDNKGNRKNYSILTIPEPQVSGNVHANPTKTKFKYADGKSRNAEAMAVHPLSSAIRIIDKQPTSHMYELRQINGKWRAVRLPGEFPSYVTDMWFIHNGDFLLLRTKHMPYLFIYDMRGQIPQFYVRVHTENMAQPESVTSNLDETYAIVGSEGPHSGLYSETIPILPS